MKSMEIQVKVRKPSSAWGNAPFLLDLVSHLIDSEEEEGYNILRPITQVQHNREGRGNEYKITYFWEMHALDKCVSPPPFPPRHSTAQFPWYLASTHLPTYIGGERRWTNPVPRSYRVAVTETA